MMVTQFAGRLGSAFRTPETVESASVPVADALAARRPMWAMLESWYAGQAYNPSDWRGWSDYLKTHRLPTWIHPTYNPVARAVDWYPGHMYRGSWSEDGQPLPDGSDNIIPIPEDVRAQHPNALAAAFQSLTWGNWRAVLPAMVAGCALRGNALIEIVDDMEGDPARRKVRPILVPIWQVVDLALNEGGDVKAYALEYTVKDPNGTAWTFRKAVDGETITTSRDGQVTSQIEHGYGFCPAVWILFRRRDSAVFGVPLTGPVLPKLDRVNGIIAHIEAYIARLANQPMLLIGTGSVSNALDTADSPNGVVSPRQQQLTATGSKVSWLQFKSDNGRVASLLAQADMGGINDRIRALQEEVEADLPEVVMDQQLRSMTSITGPAADRLMSDVKARYDEAGQNFDSALVKIMQMSVAIGGMRANAGDWGSDLSREQAKFRQMGASGTPLGMESYARGDLGFAIEQRALVPTVAPEPGTPDHATMRETEARSLVLIESLRTDWALNEAGVPEDQVQAILDMNAGDAIDAFGPMPDAGDGA